MTAATSPIGAVDVAAVRQLGQALGVLDAAGHVRRVWFTDPAAELGRVLTDDARRAALGSFLDAVVPGPASDKPGWHPLLWTEAGGAPAFGNLYLLLEEGGLVGIAGELRPLAGDAIVTLSARVPLLRCSTTLEAIVASAEHPMVVSFDVSLAGTTLGLAGISGELDVVLQGTPRITPSIVLRGLHGAGSAPNDVVLDLSRIEETAVDFVVALLGLAVRDAPEPIRSHLLPFFGLAPDGPRLPLLELARDGEVLRTWLRVIATDPSALRAWFGHFVALVTGTSSSASPTIAGTGVLGDALRGRIFAAHDVELDLTLAVADGKLYPGVEVAVGPPTALQLVCDVVPIGLPLRAGDPDLLPVATVALRSFSPLVSTADVHVGVARGGIDFAGGIPTPILELIDVRVGTHAHPRVDLTHLDAVGELVNEAIATFLRDALGPGPGVHLLALVGITDVVPQSVDLLRLVTDPIGAVAAFHRAVLLDADPAHGRWRAILGEIAILAGVPGGAASVTGTGTAGDPWAFALASTPPPLRVRAVAWRTGDSSSANVAVHLGLQVVLEESGFAARVTSELFALAIPATGAPELAIFHEHSAMLGMSPPPAASLGPSFSVRADEVAAGIDWIIGRAPEGVVTARGVVFTVGTEALPAFDARYPVPVVDATSSTALASAFGVIGASAADGIERILRAALARAARRFGGDQRGAALLALTGLARGELGLPDDAPLLGGSLVEGTPAFRAWLSAVATGVSADGRSSARPLLRLVSALACDRLGDVESAPRIEGAGTEDDAWRVALDPARVVELLVALRGGTSSPGLLAALGGADRDAYGFAAAAIALRGANAAIASAVDPADDARLGEGTSALLSFLAASDGLVPIASQAPDAFGPVRAPFETTHVGIVRAPGAIAAVHAEVATPTVLLTAPFLDGSSWNDLLGGATASHIDFRLEGTPPDRVDLSGVTAADYYVAQLEGDDDAALTLQIARILARLEELHPGRRATLVAHSMTGRAAVRAAEATPLRVAKVVTLATPHLGTSPPWATDGGAGVALRLAGDLVPALRAASTAAATLLADAIVEARSASTGAPLGGASGRPVALASLTVVGMRPASVPVVALSARAASSATVALASLAATLRTLAPVGPAAPTALTFGLAVALDAAAPSGTLQVRTSLRLDLGTIGLADATADHAARAFGVDIDVERVDGWVLGGAMSGPGGAPWPARIRRATFTCTHDGAHLTTHVALVDAALVGPPRTIGLDDASAPALLDALFGVLGADPAGAQLVAALRAIGVLLPTAARVSADALAALRTDGAAWLAPHLRAALATTLYGHVPATGLALDALGLVVLATPDGLQVTAQSDDADPLRFDLDVAIALPSLALTGRASVTAGGFTVAWTPPAGLSVAIPGWLEALPLVPFPDGAAWRARIGEMLPRLLISVAGDALLARLLPVRLALPPLDAFFSGRIALPEQSFALNASSFGILLRRLSIALGHPAEGLYLPPGLLIDARDVDDHAVVSLSTPVALGGIVGLSLELGMYGLTDVRPAGHISLSIPGGTWSGVRLEAGASAAGIELALVVGDAASPTRVTFLPTFGGWEGLIAGGVALLPYVLDRVRVAIPDSVAKTRVLGVASAFELYDGTTFASATARFRELAAHGLVYDDPTLRREILGAVISLFGPGSPWSLPGGNLAFVDTGPTPRPLATWAFAPPGWTHALSLTFDWTAAVPGVSVAGGLTTTTSDGLGFTIDLDAQLFSPVHVVAGVELENPLGMGISPRIELGVTTDGVVLAPLLCVFPLHHPRELLADEALALLLLPTPSVPTPDAETLALTLSLDVLLPVVTFVLERARGTTALWPSGPTLGEIVTASALFTAAPNRHLQRPLPDVATVIGNLVAALHVDVTIGDVTLTFGNIGPGDLGVAIQGEVDVPVDTVTLRLLLGERPPGTDRVSFVALHRLGTTWALAPALQAEHFGVGLAGIEGRPLVSTEVVRIGGASIFSWFDVELAPFRATFDGAGVGIDDLGITLGAADHGDNGIAKGMMRGGGGGDGAPAQPGFGIDVDYRRSRGLEARLHGPDPRRIWLGVHAAFGPLHIDQIGVELASVSNPAWIEIFIDGGVNVSGFAAQVDQLGVRIPIAHLDDVHQWGIDLAGLAVAYSKGGVSVLGGLRRREIEGGIEYDGMLVIRAQTLGIVAIGAWSKLHDAHGDYDSLFVFAGAFFTVQFPPYFVLQAIGAGFGYNRALVVPTDMNAVPGFPLVAILDDPDQLAADPMAALDRMSAALPARRGSLWFAAGIRGQLFNVIDVVAVLYVALDGGVEIGVIGVGRLAQPKASPIVMIELAVKARYSSAEGVLSIQAQLTNNSWFLIPDCQLTGGFALFIWFPRGQFVLTAGGYHPSFVPEPQFPIVPRLGFRCDLGPVHLKGEAYFALTNSCVMAGVRLEASYDVGWLRAWFEAWADFLLSWDPFHYEVSIGVRLGADFHIEIDLLFGTVDISFSVSVGASLSLVGPPLHGTVHANLGPIGITVPFGSDPTGVPDALPWGVFAAKYVQGNDPQAKPVTAQPTKGLVAPPAGGTPPDGSAELPWKIAVEHAFATSTAMPATAWRGPSDAADIDAAIRLDIAPMHETSVTSTHRLRIETRAGVPVSLAAGAFGVTTRSGDFPEAVWSYDSHSGVNAAARNTSAIAGLDVTAEATLSALHTGEVDVAHLVDVGEPKPLPFRRHKAVWRETAIAIGEAATRFGSDFTTVEAVELLGVGSPMHAGLGVRNPATSARSLASVSRRTAPPLVAPLATGMTLLTPDRGIPEVGSVIVLPPPDVPLIKLAHATRFAVSETMPRMKTSVRSPGAVPRLAPPRSSATAVGKLVRLDDARPATSAARTAPRAAGGPRARAAFGDLTAAALDSQRGVALAAGAAQAWDLDARVRVMLALAGDAARIVALARGGRILLDTELTPAADGLRLTLPPGTARVVVWSLGRAPAHVDRGFAAVSLAFSPQSPAALGWHEGSLVHVVDATRALGRGAQVRVSHAMGAAGLRRAAEVIAGATTVETTLPREINAVLVATGATDDEAITVGVRDAIVHAPLVFASETGRAALYPVTASGAFAVTVARGPARLFGVMGLRGRPSELAAALHGRSLGSLLPDVPLSASGGVRLHFERGEK